MKKEQKMGYIYLLLTFFLWGSLYVVSKFVLGKLPPFSIVFGRYFIAYLALTVMTLRKPKVKIVRKDYKYIFMIGFLGYFISVSMQLMGTKYAGSSLASLINSMNPITISLMAALILKEKLTGKKIIGIGLSLIGVYCIIGNSANVNTTGVVLSLGAVLGWSFMSVMTRKVTQKYDALTVTRAAVGITVLCDFPVCIWEVYTTAQPIQLDVAAFSGLCYMALFCTAITLVLWNRSLSLLEASVCSSFYPIQTLTSSVLGILVLDEAVSGAFFAGSGLIIAGVLVSCGCSELWGRS